MYSRTIRESSETELVEFVVYDRRDPNRRVVGKAATWEDARDQGARALGIRSEFTWAVLRLEGETIRQAIARGLSLDSMWKRTEEK